MRELRRRVRTRVRRRARSRSWSSYALTVVLLALTALGGLVSQRAVDHQEQTRFDHQAERLDAALFDRFTAYVQVLRGTVGMFQATDDVSRADWDAYVSALHLDERYPGFKSLSWSPAVATADLDAFAAGVRREPVPAGLGDAGALRSYTVKAPPGSSGEPAVHAPILYVAPFTRDNQQVLGFDMMREPDRRAAMERAASTGRAVASPRLQLSGSTDDAAGFIVFVPVKKDGRMLGWVTSAFLAESFTAGLDVARGTSVDFETRDAADRGALLFSSRGTDTAGAPVALDAAGDAPYDSTTTIEVPGGSWSMRHVAPPDFVSGASRFGPWLVILLGLLATLVLWFLARGGERWQKQTVLLEEQALDLTEARDGAEAATRATSAFLATMSHEIRTPLHAVVGAGTLLIDTPLDAEQAEHARVIRSSGDHLLHVINEILDYSKLEAGQVDLERAAFDPAACVVSALDLVGGAARVKGLVVTSDLDLPRLVVGDVSRLRQVLLNLLSNAVKFTPAGGTVAVVAHTLPDEVLAFAVTDSGMGIAPDQVDRLFDAFTQADASTTRTHGGTGLGLSIARRLVTAMGGEITVEGALGVGATFRFTVVAPAAVAPEVVIAAPSARAAVAPPAPLRVLVAEDDADSQYLAQRMLSRLGHLPDVVGDGAAAVAAARATDYDVVFLDLHMPVLDGVTAAGEILRTRAGTRAPYLVAMTGSVSPAEHAAATAAGIADVVAKPFALDDLAAVLARAVATHEGGRR